MGIAQFVYRRLSGAFEVIHKAGVRHNDLHWRNVIFDQSAEPVVIDFDNATVHTRSHDTAQEADHVKVRNEIYLLLTGTRCPSREATNADLTTAARQVLKDEPAALPDNFDFTKHPMLDDEAAKAVLKKPMAEVHPPS